jgi:hypothetical protein
VANRENHHLFGLDAIHDSVFTMKDLSDLITTNLWYAASLTRVIA